MGKKKLIKIGSIILICVVIDIALHLLTSKYSTMPKFPNYSKLAETDRDRSYSYSLGFICVLQRRLCFFSGTG